MLCRQKEEALVLYNSQKMSWLVAAKELGWFRHLLCTLHLFVSCCNNLGCHIYFVASL